MNIAPKPPLARQGQQLASHGRYGDSQLVHMNPYEVQGLAAMSPTGQLTKNPVTGQPEAFLPFLAPLLGKAIGTKLLAGKLGAGLAGAIGSGIGTFAESGSLEKGLVSGITGFGLGKIFSAGAEAVGAGTELGQMTAAQQGLQEAGKAAGSVSPDILDASKILQQPNSMVNAATLGDALGTKTSVPISYNPFEGVVGGETVTPISQSAQSLLDASQQVGTATSALDSARQGISFGDRLAAFTEPEGLRAMGQAALQPANLLTTGTGLGLRAQMEAQEDMQRRADEAAADDEAYAQGFRNVLTDSLGLARGSNPNPYTSKYVGNYAGGGLVKMNNGGGLDDDEYYENMPRQSATDIAGLEGPYVTGRFNDDGTLGPRMSYKQIMQSSPQAQEEGRYFIEPSPGSAAERQAFLKGGFKQDPPTDYRHGFEEEYSFFDFIGDRDLDRTLDLFGAGPSDYLAGLLAATPERLEELGTPYAEGTKPLAEYTTTKGQQFSGLDNFSDMGVGKMEPIVNQPPAADPVDPVDPTPVDPIPDPVTPDPEPELPPEPDPTFMDAVKALGIDVDGEYLRGEGRQVYDVLEDFDAFGAGDVSEVSDYFGITPEFAQDNIEIIRQNRATDALLDAAIEGGIEQVDPGEEADDPYTEGEKDAVFGLIQSGELTKPAAAEYFQIPLDEINAAYESMLAEYNKDQEAVQQGQSANQQLASTLDTFADPVFGDPDLADAYALGEIDAAELTQYSAEGGRLGKKRIMTKNGVMELANGGIATAIDSAPVAMEEAVVEQIPDDMQLGSMVGAESATFDNGMGGIDYDGLVAMTIEAVRGNVDNADEVIEMFIDEYGVEEFRKLREAVLQSIVPGAQTEGKIVGSGGGMDDEVMGMIGENHPVAVAPDEYIVAADVVSGLGDGSSEAGADILDQMMTNVRTARTGGRQPAPIDKSAVLPA